MNRQAEVKSASLTGHGCNPHSTARRLDNQSTEVEPEPLTAPLESGRRLVVALKYPMHLIAGNPNSTIRD